MCFWRLFVLLKQIRFGIVLCLCTKPAWQTRVTQWDFWLLRCPIPLVLLSTKDNVIIIHTFWVKFMILYFKGTITYMTVNYRLIFEEGVHFLHLTPCWSGTSGSKRSQQLTAPRENDANSEVYESTSTNHLNHKTTLVVPITDMQQDQVCHHEVEEHSTGAEEKLKFIFKNWYQCPTTWT